jgi:hypothetical protein
MSNLRKKIISAFRPSNVRSVVANNWELFKSWHRPLPNPPEVEEKVQRDKEVSKCQCVFVQIELISQFIF